MWAAETLRTCKTLVTSAADTWERFIWSENIWSEDFQRTEDQELTLDVHDAHPQNLQNTTEVLQVLPATSQKTPDPQNGSSGCGSVYDAHPLIRPRTTRVLEILPATSQDMTNTISCRLSVISLDPPYWPWAHRLLSVDYALDYRAVSYVWGDASITNDILVEGKPFTIRNNLWNFLAQARKERFSGTLWIDAICINQADIEERNRQVAIMGLIYSKAIDVWAWVGLGTEIHYSAFRHIAEIDWPVEVRRKEKVQGPSTIEQHFESMKLFLDLKYWSRLWITQEFVLARSVTIQCGPEVLSGILLDYFSRVVMGLGEATSDSLEESLFRSPGVGVLHSRLLHTSPLHRIIGARAYLCILMVFAHFWARADCTDPHDYVYALLSLDSATHSEIVPDYRKPLLQLFLEVVLFIDRESGTTPEALDLMISGLIMMQERLGLSDNAEATQVRLRLTDHLVSDNTRLYRRITRA